MSIAIGFIILIVDPLQFAYKFGMIPLMPPLCQTLRKSNAIIVPTEQPTPQAQLEAN